MLTPGSKAEVEIDVEGVDINNITFNEVSPYKRYAEYDTDANNCPHRILVKGSNSTITLRSKLAGEASPTTLYTILDDAPLSDLIQSNDSELTITGIENASGCTVSFVQTTEAPYCLSASEIMGSESNNITFTVPFFFISDSDSGFNLDLPVGPGTVVNMYTRNIVNNAGTYKVVLYKYLPYANVAPNLLDWNDYRADNKGVVTVKFEHRYKKEIDIPQRCLQHDDIDTLYDLLDKVEYSTIANASWVPDITYTQNTAPWFSFCSLTKSAMRSILPKFFTPPTTQGHKKMNVITRSKLILAKDKLGNVIFEVDHDGIIRAPFMSTSAFVNNQDNVGQVAPSSLSDVIRRSVIGFSRKL
jgi:hypothetical protein